MWPFKREKENLPEPIGELYCGVFRGLSITCFCPINTSFGPGQRVIVDFFKVYPKDIQGLTRTRIKFFGDWYPIEDILFKGEDESIKDSIKKRYELENNIRLENAKRCMEIEIAINKETKRHFLFFR